MLESLLMIFFSCLFILAGIVYLNLDREDDIIKLQENEIKKEGETK